MRTLALTPLLLLVACESTLTGNEGNFQFSYQADDRVTDFNKPIAVGARLDLEVVDVGARLPVELTDASFDDPAVLDVVGFSGNVVTVEGKGDGGALLSVAGTTAQGEDLTDSVNLLSRVPEVHKLMHTCGVPGSTEQAYLTGQPIYVPFEFEMANGQPVIGYGYYPVGLAGTGVMDPVADWQGQQYMAYDTVSAGPITMTSDIDGTTLDLVLVEEAALDGVVEPIAFVLEDIDVGDKNAFYVLPSVGGLAVCQAEVTFEVVSDTPATCAVRKLQTAPAGATSGQRYEYGWFEVEGVAEGTCSYTVTYPGGTGATAQFSYPIQP